MPVIADKFAQEHSDHPYFSPYFSQMRELLEDDKELVQGRTRIYEQMYMDIGCFLEAFSHPSFDDQRKKDILNRKHPWCIDPFSGTEEECQSAQQAYRLAWKSLSGIVFNYRQLAGDLIWSYGLDERPIDESLRQALTASIHQSIHDLQSLFKEEKAPFSGDKDAFAEGEEIGVSFAEDKEAVLDRVSKLVKHLEKQLEIPIDEIFPDIKKLVPKGEKTGHQELAM